MAQGIVTILNCVSVWFIPLPEHMRDARPDKSAEYTTDYTDDSVQIVWAHGLICLTTSHEDNPELFLSMAAGYVLQRLIKEQVYPEGQPNRVVRRLLNQVVVVPDTVG